MTPNTRTAHCRTHRARTAACAACVAESLKAERAQLIAVERLPRVTMPFPRTNGTVELAHRLGTYFAL